MIKNIVLDYDKDPEKVIDADLYNYSGRKNIEKVLSVEALVNTTKMSLSSLGDFFINLQKLRLDNSTITSVRDIGCTFYNLRYLSLNNCEITSLNGISTLSQNIEELYLQKNLIKDVSDLMGMDKLRILDLTDNKIVDAANLQFLSCCSNLKTLYFGDNPAASNVNFKNDLQKYAPQLNVILKPRQEEKMNNFRSQNLQKSGEKTDLNQDQSKTKKLPEKADKDQETNQIKKEKKITKSSSVKTDREDKSSSVEQKNEKRTDKSIKHTKTEAKNMISDQINQNSKNIEKIAIKSEKSNINNSIKNDTQPNEAKKIDKILQNDDLKIKDKNKNSEVVSQNVANKEKVQSHENEKIDTNKKDEQNSKNHRTSEITEFEIIKTQHKKHKRHHSVSHVKKDEDQQNDNQKAKRDEILKEFIDIQKRKEQKNSMSTNSEKEKIQNDKKSESEIQKENNNIDIDSAYNKDKSRVKVARKKNPIESITEEAKLNSNSDQLNYKDSRKEEIQKVHSKDETKIKNSIAVEAKSGHDKIIISNEETSQNDINPKEIKEHKSHKRENIVVKTKDNAINSGIIDNCISLKCTEESIKHHSRHHRSNSQNKQKYSKNKEKNEIENSNKEHQNSYKPSPPSSPNHDNDEKSIKNSSHRPFLLVPTKLKNMKDPFLEKSGKEQTNSIKNENNSSILTEEPSNRHPSRQPLQMQSDNDSNRHSEKHSHKSSEKSNNSNLISERETKKNAKKIDDMFKTEEQFFFEPKSKDQIRIRSINTPSELAYRRSQKSDKVDNSNFDNFIFHNNNNITADFQLYKPKPKPTKIDTFDLTDDFDFIHDKSAEKKQTSTSSSRRQKPRSKHDDSDRIEVKRIKRSPSEMSENSHQKVELKEKKETDDKEAVMPKSTLPPIDGSYPYKNHSKSKKSATSELLLVDDNSDDGAANSRRPGSKLSSRLASITQTTITTSNGASQKHLTPSPRAKIIARPI